MKRFFVLLFSLLLLCVSAAADPVSFGSLSFDRESEYIDLGDTAVGDWEAFTAFLREFPDLKKVDMFATPVTADRVEALEKAFPDVAFGWTLKMMRYHFVRTDADAYSALDGASHPRHTDEEFRLLKYCPDLLALDLGHNDIQSADFLESMPRLRLLILAENPRLQCLDRIAELQDLEYLELFSCGIEDITPLTKLTRLMDLNLSNNRVKDWRPLKEMTWLKRLWISGMCTGRRRSPELTAEERRELEEALPDTEIVYVGEPTEKGWRYISGKQPAPHYAVIREMFYGETQFYVPFEDSAPLSPESPDSWVLEEVEIEEDVLNGTMDP